MPDDKVRVTVDANTNTAERRFRSLFQTLGLGEKDINAITPAFAQLTSEAIRADIEVKKLTRSEKNLNEQLARKKIRLRETIREKNDYRRETGILQRENVNLHKALEGTRLNLGNITQLLGPGARALGNYSSRVSALTPLLGNLKVAFAAVGVVAFTKSLQASLSTFARWETQLKTATALGNLSGEQIGNLETQLLDLAKTTRFTAEEVGKAYNDILRATGDVSGSYQVLKVAIDGAIAGGLQLTELTPLLIGTTRGLGVELSDTGRVMEALNSVARRTNITTGDIARSAAFATSSANALGIEVEELAAALGIAADNGFLFTRSGPAFRTAVFSLINPTNEFQGRLDELGLSMQDMTQGGVNVTRILRTLARAGFEASEFPLFFRDRAAALLAVLFRNVDALDALTSTIIKNRGEMKNQVEIMEQGIEPAHRLWISQLGALGIAITKVTKLNTLWEYSVRKSTRTLRSAEEGILKFPGLLNDVYRSLTDLAGLDSYGALRDIGRFAEEAEEHLQSLAVPPRLIKNLEALSGFSLADAAGPSRVAFAELAKDSEVFRQRLEEAAVAGQDVFTIFQKKRQEIDNQIAALQAYLGALGLIDTKEREATLQEIANLERKRASISEINLTRLEEISIIERQRSISEKLYQEEYENQKNLIEARKEFNRLLESPPDISIAAPFPQAPELGLQDATALISDTFNQTRELDSAVKRTNERMARIKNIGEEFTRNFTSGFTQALSTADSIGDALAGIGRNLFGQFLNAGFQSLFSGAGFLSFLPGRQSGGPVERGRGYVVGERGPELFVPRNSGTIVPNATVNNYFTLQGTGNFAEDVLTIAEAVRNNS